MGCEGVSAEQRKRLREKYEKAVEILDTKFGGSDMTEKTLFDEMQSFKNMNFRDIYKKFIYIDCRELLEEILPGELENNITGIFAYCYIDKTEGLSFRPGLLAAMNENSIQVFTFPHQEDTIFVIRLRDETGKRNELHEGARSMYICVIDRNTCSYIDLSVLNVDVDSFDDFKNMIDETYDAGKEVEILRSEEFDFLDEFRNPSYPDDVQALLYKKGIAIEVVWVRLNFRSKKEIFGELLNEPYSDFGCHKGSMIGLVMTKENNEDVLAFSGKIARQVFN